MSDTHRVVIIGGGFAGLQAAQALKHDSVSIKLIDKRNFHLFQPLLYQVATGSLSPGEIAAPIRAILSKQKNTQVLLGDAVGIDPEARRIHLRDGAEVEYDTLIVASGSQSSYFGNNAWSRWAPALKTIEDATAIRHKIVVAFEAAERITDPGQRRAWLTFVIVGAGPTGVELAGALGEIANHTLKHDFRSIRPEESRIMIVDSSPRVLPTYPEDLSKKAETQLLHIGVRVRNGLMVTNVDEHGVTVKTKAGEQQHIHSHTVLWAAGVAITDFARTLAEKTGAETQRNGQILVAPDLTIPKYPNIYVVGDLASLKRPNGKPLPGVAQVAMQEGAYAARTIMERLKGETDIKPFHYLDKGDLAVIGRAAAVADVFGVHLSGLPAWLVWLFIHLIYIVEFQSRILVFIQWGFSYLTYSRGALLITGPAARDFVTQKPEELTGSPEPQD